MSWSKAAQEINERNGERFEVELPDEDWARNEPPWPPLKRGRRSSTDFREIFDAIQFPIGMGSRRQAIPPIATNRNHSFARRDSGVLETMLDRPQGLARELAGRSDVPEGAPLSLPGGQEFHNACGFEINGGSTCSHHEAADSGVCTSDGRSPDCVRRFRPSASPSTRKETATPGPRTHTKLHASSVQVPSNSITYETPSRRSAFGRLAF